MYVWDNCLSRFAILLHKPVVPAQINNVFIPTAPHPTNPERNHPGCLFIHVVTIMYVQALLWALGL